MSTPESPNTPRPSLPPSRASAAMIPAHLTAAGTAKIRDQHRVRKAIVYVRQSSPQQVAENQESTARQYALADVAVALGWPRDRVEIVDRDQGQSGKHVEGRPGFQYVLAEIGLDHVGMLLGVDASRLARSDPDWAPLVRWCGVFRTLLGDFDGLYDPTDFNDRLLLNNRAQFSCTSG
jgi:DNA invertase Pin-like site-specific DNA recombinase